MILSYSFNFVKSDSISVALKNNTITASRRVYSIPGGISLGISNDLFQVAFPWRSDTTKDLYKRKWNPTEIRIDESFGIVVGPIEDSGEGQETRH